MSGCCPPMLGPPPLLSLYHPQNVHPACKEEQLNQMMPGAPSCPDMQGYNSWPVFSRATSWKLSFWKPHAPWALSEPLVHTIRRALDSEAPFGFLLVLGL